MDAAGRVDKDTVRRSFMVAAKKMRVRFHRIEELVVWFEVVDMCPNSYG